MALIRPRDSPCARYDGGCIGVHAWASVRPGDNNDTVAMCFKCGWRNCKRVHPRRCSALVYCALCGQSSHDMRYHAEFQQYVSRGAIEMAQWQVEAAAVQGLPNPSYAAPRLHALPPPVPVPFSGQVPHVGQTTPDLAALQNALRYAPRPDGVLAAVHLYAHGGRPRPHCAALAAQHVASADTAAPGHAATAIVAASIAAAAGVRAGAGLQRSGAGPAD